MEKFVAYNNNFVYDWIWIECKCHFKSCSSIFVLLAYNDFVWSIEALDFFFCSCLTIGHTPNYEGVLLWGHILGNTDFHICQLLWSIPPPEITVFALFIYTGS